MVRAQPIQPRSLIAPRIVFLGTMAAVVLFTVFLADLCAFGYFHRLYTGSRVLVGLTSTPIAPAGWDIAHAVPLTLIAGLGHWLRQLVNLPLLVCLLVGAKLVF